MALSFRGWKRDDGRVADRTPFDERLSALAASPKSPVIIARSTGHRNSWVARMSWVARGADDNVNVCGAHRPDGVQRCKRELRIASALPIRRRGLELAASLAVGYQEAALERILVVLAVAAEELVKVLESPGSVRFG